MEELCERAENSSCTSSKGEKDITVKETAESASKPRYLWGQREYG